MSAREISVSGETKEYAALIGAFLLFRFALDVAYERFMYVVYKFDTPINFWYDVSISRYLLSIFIYAIFVSVIGARTKDMGNVFLTMAAFFLVGPMTSEFGLNYNRPIEPIIYTILALICVDIVSRIPLPGILWRIPVRGGPNIAVAMSVFSIVYLLIWAYLSGSMKYFSLDVRDVYLYRDRISELIDVGVFSYLNLWTYKVFTIFLICVFLQRRQYALVALVFGAQIVFFGLTSHRVVIFLPLLAIAIWIYIGKIDRLWPLLISAGLSVLVVLFLFELIGVGSLAEIAIRRAFFVPSGLTFQWFDYFSFHPHVYWADRLLASYSSGEYVGVNVPRLIGDYFVPGSDSAANAGLVSAGYAQAGVWGVMLYALILGLALAVLNSIVRSGVPLWLVAALTIGPLRTALADSDLFTSLLSHGLGLSVLLLWLYRVEIIRSNAAGAPS